MLTDERKSEIIIETTDMLVKSNGKKYSELAEDLAAKYAGEELFLSGFISGACSVLNDLSRKGVDVSSILKKLMGKGGSWQ